MRWNQRPKAERPEYPKLIAVSANADQIRDLLVFLRHSDPQAGLVESGGRGLYVRVHNTEAEAATKDYAEARTFPRA